MPEKLFYGGMAVIEGVMMRGRESMVIAARRPNGEISLKTENLKKWKGFFWQKPFFRGVFMLVDSLVTGMKAISWSANEAAETEEEELSKKDIAIAVAFAVLFAVGVFMVLPTLAVHYLSVISDNSIYLNSMEGIVRIALFILYVWLISRMKDIQRVFAYHGAEHKTLNAYEAGADLIPDVISGFSRLHPRCGTAFLFIVMMVSIFLFAFLGWPSLLWRIASRVILLPVVAGASYEILRYTAKNCDKAWIKPLMIPGMMFQKFTTREPDAEQIEIAAAALTKVLELEKKIDTPEGSDSGNIDTSSNIEAMINLEKTPEFLTAKEGENGVSDNECTA